MRAGQGGHASPAEYAYDDDEVEVAEYMEETPVVGDAQAGGGTGEAIEPVTPPRAQTPPGPQPVVNEVGTVEQVVPLDVTSDAMIAQFLGNQERLRATRGPVRGGGGRSKGKGKGKWAGGKTRPLVVVSEQQEV